MAIGIDPEATRTYILASDRNLKDDSQKTKFLIGAVPEHINRRLGDAITYSGDGMSGLGTRNHLALKWGLHGVDPEYPLRARDGSPIPFVREQNEVVGKASDEFIAHLTSSQRMELVAAILATGQLEEKDVEKPGPLPEGS